MKPNKILIGMGIMILVLIASASALTQTQETASVSRIVGNSPGDLRLQLQRTGDLWLDNGIFTGTDSYERPGSVMGSVFGSGKVSYPNMNSFSELKKLVDGSEDAMVVIDSANPREGKMDEINLGGMGDKLTDDNANELSAGLDNGDGLVVLNSDYAGLNIPDAPSLTGELAGSSSMVAPMSYSSRLFLNSLLCNLGKHDTIGKVFTNARNNYYLNTQDRFGFNDLLGLTMQSYSLYGLPTRKMYSPASSSDYCKNYQEDFHVAPMVKSGIMGIAAEGDGNTLTEEFEFNTGNFTIVNSGNYSLISTGATMDSIDLSKPILPMRALEEELPKETIIKQMVVTGMSDAVDITLGNLPMNGLSGFLDRVCYEESGSAGVDFGYAYTDDALAIYPKIHPVEVVNCTSGHFKLYKKINYKIEYMTKAPVKIANIETPEFVAPGSNLTAEVHLKKLKPMSEPSYLGIVDASDEVIASKEITPEMQAEGDIVISMPMIADDIDGFYRYKAVVYYGNVSVASKKFNFNVMGADIMLLTPEVVGTTVNVTMVVGSLFGGAVNAKISYRLAYNGETVEFREQNVSLNPGINVFSTKFTGLDRAKIAYDLIAGVVYKGTYKTATATIITEHAPVITQGGITVSENASVRIYPKIEDADGDVVKISIAGWRYDLKYTTSSPVYCIAVEGADCHTIPTNFEDSGVYYVNITANDGIKTTSKIITLTINNVNRAPIITADDKITAYENTTISFNPSVSDPDNENSATNDDNNLSMTYGGLMNASMDYAFDFDSAGNYTETLTVSDGETTVYKDIQIEVINVNRPPRIDANDVYVNEGMLVNVTASASDPDNENEADNDDNNLTVTYGAPLNASGMWQTNYDDSGNYTAEISVTDGEFTASKSIKISVLNMNRPPVLEDIEDLAINEGELAAVSASASDPDGNNVTITYGVPLDANGEWQTNYDSSGNYTINVSASDGETAVSKTMKLTVLNVNRAPVIQPIAGINAKEGETINLEVDVGDPDNQNNVTNDDNALTVTYPAPFDSNGTWNVNYEQSGSYNLTVKVSDGELNASTNVAITMSNTNRAPEISASDVMVREGELANISASVRDPDNENNVTNDDNVIAVTYESPFDSNGLWQTDYGSSGEYNTKIVASDGEFSVNKTVTVKVVNFNRAPVLVVPENVSVMENETVKVEATATDPDNKNNVTNDDNNLTIAYGAPLDANGEWKTEFFDAGKYTADVTASDGLNATTKQVVIYVLNNNRAPVISNANPSENEAVIKENESIEFSIEASDLDNESITYEWRLGDEVVSTSESYEFVSDFHSAGEYEVGVVVADTNNATDSREWNLKVENVNLAPVIYNEDKMTVHEEDEVVIEVNASDEEENTTLVYSIGDSRFSQEGNVFSWQTSYNDSGVYYVNITASDGDLSSSKVIELNVTNVNRAPKITSENDKSYYIARFENLSLGVSASDPDKEDNLTISWYVNSVIRATGESFVFSDEGVPGKHAKFNVTAVVDDGELMDAVEFEVVVAGKPVLDGFDGETSNVDDANLSNFESFTLEKTGKGKVVFLDVLDLSNVYDFVTTTKFDDKYISINSGKLKALEGKSARITIYGVSSYSNPVIYYSDEFGYGADEMGKVCPSSLCYNIAVENGSISFDVAHFSTYFVAGSEKKHLDFYAPEKVTVTLPRGQSSFSETFTIENNGLSSLDNVRVTANPLEGNGLSVEPSGFVLASGASRSITLSGDVSGLDSGEEKEIGSVRFENTGLLGETKVYAVLQEMLSLENLDVKVDDKTYSDVANGETIKIKPGSEVKMEFEVKNMFGSGVSFEDVQIGVTIKDIDGGDDMEEEAGGFDLEAGDSEEDSVSFIVPELLSEDEYDAKIEITAKNSESGEENKLIWELKFSANRNKHEIQISNAELSDSEISCNGDAEMDIYLVNAGKEDEENLRVVVENSPLGISEEKTLDLESGDSDKLSFKIEPSKDAGEVEQTLSVKVLFEDGSIAGKTSREISVYPCETVTGERIVLGEHKSTESLSSFAELVENELVENWTVILSVIFAVGIIIVLLALIVVIARRR
jgi:hypothetical protein